MKTEENRFDTRIHWTLRAWMGVEVFFGVAAIVTIFLDPTDTFNNFSWHIKEAVMAAVLGSFYFAAAFIFVLPLFAKSWQKVRGMILPTAIFSIMMDLATWIHLDEFFTDGAGTGRFYFWLASYVLPPPMFFLLYYYHQKRSAPVGEGITEPTPPGARAFLRINGLAMVAIASIIFAVPSLLTDNAPWTITPLAARALCGWLIGVGLLQVWMALEGDWSRMKLSTSMLMVLPIAMLFQLFRFSSDVDWGHPTLWVLLADVVAIAAVCGYLWSRSFATQARTSEPHPA